MYNAYFYGPTPVFAMTQNFRYRRTLQGIAGFHPHVARHASRSGPEPRRGGEGGLNGKKLAIVVTFSVFVLVVCFPLKIIIHRFGLKEKVRVVQLQPLPIF